MNNNSNKHENYEVLNLLGYGLSKNPLGRNHRSKRTN